MDDVFRALSDPTRRALLDALFERDGQTLSELTAGFEMSRFGVMKHLAVLEGSGLLATRKQGREKLHFLNPVPIRLVHDRWVSKYAEPWVADLSDLKQHLESPTRLENPMEKIFEIYIRTTPQELWDAITTSDTRRHYTFGNGFETDWQVGSPIVMTNPNAPGPLSDGTILEADPPWRLVHTMTALWEPDVVAEGETRVTWQIEQVEDSCRLIVTHDQLREGANDQLFGGWPMILSGLKTWLETGEELTTPGSLMYK